MTQTTRCSEGA